MSETDVEPLAWEPVTPRGVAAFATASNGRLFMVQLAVAMSVAVALIWFLHAAWFPTMRRAIQHLPDEGEIRAGRLEWRGGAPRLLASSHFIAFSVDLDHSGEVRSPAHVEVELGRNDFYVRSILGYVVLPYPKGWTVSVNREDLGPWWDAWRPVMLVLVALGVIAWVMAIWAVLAVLYAPPLWLLAFFANRDLKWFACWRMAGAALMPGALLMVAGILLYALGIVDLVGLGFITVGHLVLGWIYVFISPLFLPRTAPGATVPGNPFARS